MLTNLPRNCSCNQSPKKKRYGIKTDAGLRDWSWCTGKRRSPTEVQSGANVRKGCDSAGKSTDPRAQSQSGQYNKDKINEHCRTGQRAIGDLNPCTGEESNCECRD